MTREMPGLAPLMAMAAGKTLLDVLSAIPEKAVAVSGGVDSMTLAVIAHRADPDATTMFHAVSPAVPPEATDRVRAYAERETWRLALIDAGEFDNENYLSNPLDRCFYCKTDLYGAIAARASGTIMSGTNTDDLGDFRPGLKAAAHHAVRHPYVEAGFAKSEVRRAAKLLGLSDLQALPAMPCLSSRIETGLAVSPDLVRSIHAAENLIAARVISPTIRCRAGHAGIRVELDNEALNGLGESDRRHLADDIGQLFATTDIVTDVTFAPYRQGSAFLGKPGDV